MKSNRTIKAPWKIVGFAGNYQLYNQLERYIVDRKFETILEAWEYAETL